MHGGVGAAGDHLQVGLVDVGELDQLLRSESFDVIDGGGAGFHGDDLAREVLGRRDVGVVGAHHNLEAGTEIGVGKVDGLLAGGLDEDRRQRHVEIAGGQTGDQAVEVHGDELVLEPGLLGDRLPQVDVEAGIFPVLALEFEGHERRVDAHAQLLRVGAAAQHDEHQPDQ